MVWYEKFMRANKISREEKLNSSLVATKSLILSLTEKQPTNTHTHTPGFAIQRKDREIGLRTITYKQTFFLTYCFNMFTLLLYPQKLKIIALSTLNQQFVVKSFILLYLNCKTFNTQN